MWPIVYQVLASISPWMLVGFVLGFCFFFVFVWFSLVDVCGLFWIWFRGGAPIIPKKGLPDGFVPLIVHGFHYPTSARKRRDRLVVCMTEEPHQSLAHRCLVRRELCIWTAVSSPFYSMLASPTGNLKNILQIFLFPCLHLDTSPANKLFRSFRTVQELVFLGLYLNLRFE